MRSPGGRVKGAAARRDARGDGCVDIQRSNNFNKSRSLPENSKSNYSRSHPRRKTFTVNKAGRMIGARARPDMSTSKEREEEDIAEEVGQR